MKKIYILFLLAFAATSCQDFTEENPNAADDNSIVTRAGGSEGQDYYWYQGEKVYITADKSNVNVIMDDSVLKSSVSGSLFEKVNVEPDNSKQLDGMVKLKFKSGKATSSEYTKTVASLKQNGEIKYVLPYFERGGDAEPIGTSDIFHVKIKNDGDIALLEKTAKQLDVQVIEEIPYTPGWYTLSILGSGFNSSVEASNYFYETGQFEDVDPAFMFDFKPSAYDTEFSRQWGMNDTSYPNIDINVIPAWGITRGAGIKVAVVDSPIDSGHSDLNDNIHSLSYNALLKRTPSATYSYGVDPHGTHVAGIIAAERNGSQVIGVAYESNIVRVSHNLIFTSTMASELASGINWAWKSLTEGGAGVDVINCSWGDRDQYHNVHMELHSTVLEQAIVDAMTLGRDGKGCVVVFAAGNSGELGAIINYPGNFDSRILTVGSINSNGSRSSFSGYGTMLDVVAPGGNIWSTIPNNGTAYMSGTSMAAPHVAGIAALILSAKPNLTREQVAFAITETADNGVRFGRRTYETGWGLVNAYKAVTYTHLTVADLPVPVISANNTTVAEGEPIVFSVNNPGSQSGITYEWRLNGEIVSGIWTSSIVIHTDYIT